MTYDTNAFCKLFERSSPHMKLDTIHSQPDASHRYGFQDAQRPEVLPLEMCYAETRRQCCDYPFIGLECKVPCPKAFGMALVSCARSREAYQKHMENDCVLGFCFRRLEGPCRESAAMYR